MRDVFISTLLECAKEDSRIMLLTADLGFKVLDEFQAQLPEQFINVGVAEQNMTGIAAGLAIEGHIVFTYSIGNFVSLRCLEQIRNDVCYHRLPVVVVCIGGGLSYGSLGASHHATEDIAILRALPEMRVVCPGDNWEVTAATKAFITQPSPSYFRLDRNSSDNLPIIAGEEFEFCKPRIVREGKDLLLLCTGGILGEAYNAAESLYESHHLDVCLVSVHTISELEPDTLRELTQNIPIIVTVEEHNIKGGLGGAVSEMILEFDEKPKIFKRLGITDGFCREVGSQDYLRNYYSIDSKGLFQTLASLVR